MGTPELAVFLSLFLEQSGALQIASPSTPRTPHAIFTLEVSLQRFFEVMYGGVGLIDEGLVDFENPETVQVSLPS